MIYYMHLAAATRYTYIIIDDLITSYNYIAYSDIIPMSM